MPNVFKSRKFYAALVALAFAFLGPRAGLDQTLIEQSVYVLISYIIGTGLESFRK